MAMIDVPFWITVKRGRAPILLLAPHGGRRHDTHPNNLLQMFRGVVDRDSETVGTLSA
jgi:hypothetical protein